MKTYLHLAPRLKVSCAIAAPLNASIAWEGTPGSHHKILGARRMTCCKFRTEGLQIFGAAVQTIVPRTTSHLGLVHPCDYMNVMLDTDHTVVYRRIGCVCTWPLCSDGYHKFLKVF